MFWSCSTALHCPLRLAGRQRRPTKTLQAWTGRYHVARREPRRAGGVAERQQPRRVAGGCVAGLALYTAEVERGALLQGARARIATQIESHGRQPRELERTRSLHYSEFNLAVFMDFSPTLGEYCRALILWNYPDDRRPLLSGKPWTSWFPYAAGERQNGGSPNPTPPCLARARCIRSLRRGLIDGKEPKYKALRGSGRRRRPELIVLTIP